MSKVGIETLKKNLTVIGKLVAAVDQALEDGKVSIPESVAIAFKAVPLIGVVKGIKDAKAELADLNAAELQELNAHFVKEFELRNDKAELMVEMVIELMLQVVLATEVFKTIKS